MYFHRSAQPGFCVSTGAMTHLMVENCLRGLPANLKETD
jgi:hypothetical protein